MAAGSGGCVAVPPYVACGETTGGEAYDCMGDSAVGGVAAIVGGANNGRAGKSVARGGGAVCGAVPANPCGVFPNRDGVGIAECGRTKGAPWSAPCAVNGAAGPCARPGRRVGGGGA
jgi:hypothetical protein